MAVPDTLAHIDTTTACTLAAILGLAIGSFLNVVIHRLPLMMQAQWDAECTRLLAEKAATTAPPGTALDTPPTQTTHSELPLTLSRPRSRCPHCGHRIRWFENVPVLSWVVLQGRCSQCRTPISIRYPLVEIATACLFTWCAWRWGASAATLAWCAFSAALLALALIDWDTTLLPDDLTQPLLWSGLLAALAGWTPVRLEDAVLGATAGYLSLWSIYWGFKLLTGREGMGYGDFKLLAALGAWFGWQGLLPIIVMSSVIGAIIGVGMKFTSGLREGGYIPFGPFLAGAGFAVMLLGSDTIMHAILSLLGH